MLPEIQEVFDLLLTAQISQLFDADLLRIEMVLLHLERAYAERLCKRVAIRSRRCQKHRGDDRRARLDIRIAWCRLFERLNDLSRERPDTDYLCI